MARFSDLLGDDGDDGDARDPWAPPDEHTGGGDGGDDAATAERVTTEVAGTEAAVEEPAPVERPAPPGPPGASTGARAAFSEVASEAPQPPAGRVQALGLDHLPAVDDDLLPKS